MLNIQKNIKLAGYSTFKIGGDAKEFVEAEKEKELIEALDYAKDKKLKFFILGGGSNLLFDDAGFDGLVIKLKGSGKEIEIVKGDDQPKPGEAFGEPKYFNLKCWGGEALSAVVNFAKENNLTGLEWATGIPGTVGGSIVGNAGAFGRMMAEVVNSVKAVKVTSYDFPVSNKIINYKSKECDFIYRESIFKNDASLVILSAKIILEKSRAEEIEEKMKEIIKEREEKQPKGWIGSAGSFFKNPLVIDKELRRRFEKETGKKAVDNRVPAGWLIDEAGFKGKKIGNVSVSVDNANFIVNNGGGRSEEIIMLSSIIKQKIRSKFGIQLKEEVRYVHNN